MNLLIEKEKARWYELIDIPQQVELRDAVDNGIRFPVVPAGRRSGKTERAKRFLAKQAMKNPNEKYFAAAPTQDQAKKIWFDDLKLLTFSSTHPTQPKVSPQPIIFLPNGTEIHIVGLDKPQRIEGVAWTGGVIDEIADIKPDSLNENIMPALNTVNPIRPDYRAWCWFIGVPDGLNHYYDLAMYAKNAKDPDYGYFHWKSEEILPDDVIEAAKRTMSAKQYNQEYCASFETASGRIYADYSSKNHTHEEIQPHEQLMWHHDFNYTPLSSGIAVKRGKKDIYILDEIILESAIAENAAQEFVEKFKDHKNKKVIIYGDPAGRAGEKHGQDSDFVCIERVLKESGWKYERRVTKAAPAIKDRQNAVRAKILNAAGETSLYVNPNKAKYADKGLSTVQLKKGSTFLEEDGEYQHITTAIGYMVHYEFPVTGGMFIPPTKVI